MCSRPIETERLWVRGTTGEDAPALFDILRDVETAYWAGCEPYTAVREVALEIAEAEIFEEMWYSIVEKEGGRVIGQICVYCDGPYSPAVVELGYFMAPEYQKRGYMSEAVEALCRDLFEHNLGLKMIMCEIRADNQPSRKVAAKCGFIQNPNQTSWRLNHYGKPLDQFILSRAA